MNERDASRADPRPFWQALLPKGPAPLVPPYTDAYPVQLPDGRWLLLPLRQPPSLGGRRAAASLVVDQASFDVEAALIDAMAALAKPLGADVVVGLPTPGLLLAHGIARALGHRRYVAMGYSRKFWYRDDLGVPVRSQTAPGDEKRLFIDPHLLPEIEGRRVLVVDDMIFGGATAAAAIPFLERLGAEPLALVVALRQGRRWLPAFERLGEDWPDRVLAVFDTPLFEPGEGGWMPIEDED
jgi:adenine/guanine phosphoribosyltransferase-like PRPP-binding protein